MKMEGQPFKGCNFFDDAKRRHFGHLEMGDL
jgi:hypothetical protein